MDKPRKIDTRDDYYKVVIYTDFGIVCAQTLWFRDYDYAKRKYDDIQITRTTIKKKIVFEGETIEQESL